MKKRCPGTEGNSRKIERYTRDVLCPPSRGSPTSRRGKGGPVYEGGPKEGVLHTSVEGCVPPPPRGGTITLIFYLKKGREKPRSQRLLYFGLRGKKAMTMETMPGIPCHYSDGGGLSTTVEANGGEKRSYISTSLRWEVMPRSIERTILKRGKVSG